MANADPGCRQRTAHDDGGADLQNGESPKDAAAATVNNTRITPAQAAAGRQRGDHRLLPAISAIGKGAVMTPEILVALWGVYGGFTR
jgi:hypothetical protein